MHLTTQRLYCSFEVTPATRESLQKGSSSRAEVRGTCVPSRTPRLTLGVAAQYARILEGWSSELGIAPAKRGSALDGGDTKAT